jgi:Na+/proline symporter
MNVSTPTLITFVIYIGAMLLIGFIAYRATKNFDDYILGGRSLGSFVTALSAGASDMSGWLLMGLPGAIFVAGLSESWIAIGLIAGAWLNWLFVAGRLRVHTERNKNALTLPDYFSHRFEMNQPPAAHLLGAGDAGVLHHLLRLRGRGWCAAVRKQLRHAVRRTRCGSVQQRPFSTCSSAVSWR